MSRIQISEQIEDNKIRVRNIVAESTRCSSPSYGLRTPKSTNIRLRNVMGQLLFTDHMSTTNSSYNVLPTIQRTEMQNYMEASTTSTIDEKVDKSFKIY